MIEMTNGARVKWGILAPSSPGFKPHGLVMAEYNDQLVVWAIALNNNSDTWDALSGDYFPDTPEGYHNAKYMYGRRARRILDPIIRKGILHDDPEATDGYA